MGKSSGSEENRFLESRFNLPVFTDDYMHKLLRFDDLINRDVLVNHQHPEELLNRKSLQ